MKRGPVEALPPATRASIIAIVAPSTRTRGAGGFGNNCTWSSNAGW
jgi:hypothetical protein